jgi:hypothetical protein
MGKQSLLLLIILTITIVGIESMAVASGDCDGPWQRLHGFRKGEGTACQQLGLDPAKGTCRPGERFEILCDDRNGGEYRICRGERPCGPPPFRRDKPGFGGGEYGDDHRDRHGPGDDYRRGWQPGDRRQQWDDRRGGPDCRFWDFHYDRPCPRGFMNFDCRGGCERQ